jgi:AAA lid domain
MLEAESYEFAEQAEDAFRAYLARRVKQPRFAHARSVRNAIERTRLRQANRIYEGVQAGHAPDRRDLVRIEAEDILKSSVFEGDSD